MNWDSGKCRPSEPLHAHTRARRQSRGPKRRCLIRSRARSAVLRVVGSVLLFTFRGQKAINSRKQIVNRGVPVPTHDGLFNPLLRAMRELGGSASVSEQEEAVAKLLNLSDEEASEIHRGNRTKLSYRLAWGLRPIPRARARPHFRRPLIPFHALARETGRDR